MRGPIVEWTMCKWICAIKCSLPVWYLHLCVHTGDHIMSCAAAVVCSAVIEHTDKVIYLEDNDVAAVSGDGCKQPYRCTMAGYDCVCGYSPHNSPCEVFKCGGPVTSNCSHHQNKAPGNHERCLHMLVASGVMCVGVHVQYIGTCTCREGRLGRACTCTCTMHVWLG